MSLSTALCKLFRFFVKVVNAIVDAVVQIVKPLIAGVFDILGALMDAAGDFLEGLLDNPLVLLALGLGAWWLLGGKKKDQDEDGQTNIVFEERPGLKGPDEAKYDTYNRTNNYLVG